MNFFTDVADDLREICTCGAAPNCVHHIAAGFIDRLVQELEATNHACSELSEGISDVKARVRLAADEYCECGGADPTSGCTACKIYHETFSQRNTE